MGNGQSIEPDLLISDSSKFVHMVNNCHIANEFLDFAL